MREIARVPTKIAPIVRTSSARLSAPTSRIEVLVVATVHRDPAPPEREVVVERAGEELGLHADAERAEREDPQHQPHPTGQRGLDAQRLRELAVARRARRATTGRQPVASRNARFDTRCDAAR